MASHEPTAEDHAEAQAFSFGAEHESLTMTWRNLCFDVKTDEANIRLLKNISGAVHPGELMAIMGPSGSGKTTFMNTLAARASYGKATGSIAVNGQSPAGFLEKIAYVMQEDALFPTQTPRETLRFAAALKLPHLSEEQRVALVEKVLSALGLQKCSDTMVGGLMVKGISGGEKKRTAIALELISSPSLIFLDEPTSGLDSHSAFEVVKYMKALAKAGSTIVCTIHQPSSETFDLFDKVMLLRKGECVFNGPVDKVATHFNTIGIYCKKNYNPADFAMNQLQVLSDERIAPLVEQTQVKVVEGEEKALMEASVVRGAEGAKSSLMRQLYYVTAREMQHFLRDRQALIVRAGMLVVQSLLVGFFFFGAGNKWGDESSSVAVNRAVGNHWAAVQFNMINAMFLSAQPTLMSFPLERPIFMREHATGTYDVNVYLISKSLVELPSVFVECFIGFLITYWMIDLQGNFALLALSSVGLSLVSSSISLMIGAAASNLEEAVNIAPIIYVPQMLASGVFLSVEGMPVWIRWLQWLCPLKYAIGCASASEFSSRWVPDDRQDAVTDVLDGARLYVDDWWKYVLILAGMYVAFRFLAFVIVDRKSRQFF